MVVMVVIVEIGKWKWIDVRLRRGILGGMRKCLRWCGGRCSWEEELERGLIVGVDVFEEVFVCIDAAGD